MNDDKKEEVLACLFFAILIALLFGGLGLIINIRAGIGAAIFGFAYGFLQATYLIAKMKEEE